MTARMTAGMAADKAVPRGHRRPVGSWPWLMSAAVAIAVVLTALNIHGVLFGFSWLPPVIISVGAVALFTAGARAVRLPTALVPLAGALGLLLALMLQFFADASMLGFLPNSETLEALPVLIAEANQVVLTQVAPVQPLEGMVFLTCLGLGLVTLLIDTLAVSLRMPATSGMGLLAVLLVPAIVKPSSIGPAGFAASIIGFLILLGAAHWIFSRDSESSGGPVPMSQINRAVTIGAAGVVAALVVPLAIPGFSSGLFPEGSRLSLGTSSGLNPMITLGNDLRNPGSVGRMTYVTTSDNPVYLRAVTLEDFDGDRWAPDVREDTRERGVAWMGSTTMEEIDSIAEVATTIIDTGQFVSPWLPTPYAPIEVTGLDGTWSFDPLTLSIKGENGSTSAQQQYTVRSVTPELTRESLAAANQAPSEDLDPRFLSLPEQMPELIRETAETITADTDNRYRKAMAIQQYLRSGDFVYSETAPVAGGYDGNSMDVVGRFLEERSGYCVHYSAAMAVMARAEGIPSRIAVGYAPGTTTGETVQVPRDVQGGVTELPQFSVDSDDAHAWPELYFENLGWVPFEPTPSRGVVPEYATAETVGAPDNLSPENINRESLNDQNNVTDNQDPAEEETLTRGGGAPDSNVGLVSGIAVLAGLLALLAVPQLLRSRILRGRLRKLDTVDPPAVALLAWSEVNDAAADYGAPAEPSETPRAFAARLGHQQLLGAEASAAMRRLATGYERAAYGRPSGAAAVRSAPQPAGRESAGREPAGGTTVTAPPVHPPSSAGGCRDDVALVRSSLAQNSTTALRLKAQWFPASLWRRRRP